MRFNQYSYLKTSSTQALNDLVSLGFNLKPTDSEKQQFEDFIRKIYFIRVYLFHFYHFFDIISLVFFQRRILCILINSAI